MKRFAELICTSLVITFLLGTPLGHATPTDHPGYVVAADYGTDQAALAQADGAAVAAGKALVISRDYSIDTTSGNFTLSSSIIPRKGGMLTRTGGGSNHLIIKALGQEPGLFRWINDNSPSHDWVQFGQGAVKEVYLEWFGGVAGSVGDQTTHFYQAANSCKTVQFLRGTYLLNIDLTKIADVQGLIVNGYGYGNGADGTILKGYDDAKPILKGYYDINRIQSGLVFNGLTFSQTGGSANTGNNLVDLKYIILSNFNKCHFINAGGWLTQLFWCIYIKFDGCDWYKGSSSRGLGGINAIGQSNAMTFIGGSSSGSGTSETTTGLRLGGPIAGIQVRNLPFEHWGNGIVLDNTDGKITDINIDTWFEVNNTADIQLGVKDGRNPNYITGVNIKGNFAGPVNPGGYAVELWGAALYGINIKPGYITNRTAVANLYGDVHYYGVNIEPGYHGNIPVYNGNLVKGLTVKDMNVESVATIWFTENATSPSVAGGRVFYTNSTKPTTIENFTGAVQGQQFDILVVDNNTTFKFTSSRLKGHGGTDFAAAIGDHIRVVYDATYNYYWCTVDDNTP